MSAVCAEAQSDSKGFFADIDAARQVNSGGAGEPYANRLFAAVDSALQSAGVVVDLSRIIAEYARRFPKWEADSLAVKCGFLTLDAEALAVRLVRAEYDLAIIFTDLPLRDFPLPRFCCAVCDEKSRASMRVWSIQIDSGTNNVMTGLANPPSAVAACDPLSKTPSWLINTHHGLWFGTTAAGERDRGDDMPHAKGGTDAAGSVYHFTADLATNNVRARPIVKTISPDYRPADPLQTEWTIARGIEDLAAYRPFVMLKATTACTLLHE